MNLAIDIGNTSIKYGIFEGEELIRAASIVPSDLAEFNSDLKTYDIQRLVYSTVAGIPSELAPIISKFKKHIALDEFTPLPLTNKYQSPQTLGRDRLSNVCAAIQIFPDLDVLVIDAGTCLKFDFVSKDKMYLGGAISPGLRMRFRALHEQTAQLPLLEAESESGLIGTNTFESIQSGVINGMTAEINEITRQYIELYPRLELIITGGDMKFFLNQIKSCIFAAPHLTLQGLNNIALHLPYE